jgi:hypothetical protein
MNALGLDFETIRPIDLNNEALKPGSRSTPFSTFLYAVVSGGIAAAEAQITNDIEWGLMPETYRAIFGCGQSAWGKILGEDRHLRRLEGEVLGKIDRESKRWD